MPRRCKLFVHHTLCWAVLLGGLIVLVGYATHNLWLISIGSEVTVKPTTALAFVGTGFMGLASLQYRTVIGAFVVAIITMGLAGPHGNTREFQTVGPLVPSLGTAIGFYAFCVSRWFYNLRWMRFLTVLIGVCSLSGHFLGVSELYFYFPGKSSGMAAWAAFLFVLLGCAPNIRPPARNLDLGIFK